MTAGSIIALYEEWRWWWVWVRCRCEEKSSVEGHRGGELCAARALGTKNLIGKKKTMRCFAGQASREQRLAVAEADDEVDGGGGEQDLWGGVVGCRPGVRSERGE